MKSTCSTPLIPVLIIILFASLTSACIAPLPPTPPVTPAPALTTVKVAYMPIISFGPLYIAQEEGYFAKQGINVEFEKFSSTSTALPALINGDIAVSGGQLFPGLINSVHDGAHVRIVADKGIISPGSCDSTALMVRRDLVDSGTVKTVSDLRGKKVASISDQSYGVNRALAVGNLTMEDIDMAEMPRPAILIGFENAAIDAAYLMEPAITEAVRNNKSVIFLPGYAFTPNLTNPLFYGTAFTDTNPELGRRFMIAYLQGARQYNLGKTERNLEILSKYTQLDRDVLEQTCWVEVAKTGEVPPQPVQEYMDWMYKNKKIMHSVDVDQLMDMSYVRYANGILQNSTNPG